MNYIKSEIKKLGSISLILMGILYQFGFDWILIGWGLYLLIEHMWAYGRFDFFDILGHESFGFLFIFIAFLRMEYFLGILFLIFGYLLGCDFKWTKEETPTKYAIHKIKSLFKNGS